jgi:hypothetical protein
MAPGQGRHIDRNGAVDAPEAQVRGTDRSGFLLVEALAALSISAFILLGLTSTISLMMRGADRTAARAEEIEIAGRTLAALDREIRLAARPRWSGPAAKPSFSPAGPIRSSSLGRAAGERAACPGADRHPERSGSHG